MHFARGNHRGDSAVQVAVDPANLVLARSPIAGDRMHVAVDQSGRQGCALGVDDQGCAFGVDVFLFADGGDLAIDRNHGVRIEDGLPDHRSAGDRYCESQVSLFGCGLIWACSVLFLMDQNNFCSGASKSFTTEDVG